MGSAEMKHCTTATERHFTISAYLFRTLAISMDTAKLLLIYQHEHAKPPKKSVFQLGVVVLAGLLISGSFSRTRSIRTIMIVA
jgi:hypothetical protein